MTARVVFLHETDGQTIGVLVKQTDKYLHIVQLVPGRGVRLRKVPVATASKGGRLVPNKVRDAGHNGKPYPLRRARAHYRRMGKALGITKGALDALKEAI